MREANGLNDLIKSIESLPIFVILDTIYSKNDDSPVALNKPATKQYGELVKKVEDIMLNKLQIESATDVRSLPFTSIFSISEMIIYSVTKTEDIMLQVMNPEYQGNFIPCHSLNVAYLSYKVGACMNLDFKELNELCVAGLLHDIGMTRIAPDYYYHDRALNERERAMVETHPNKGYQFFEPLANEFPWLLRVVREEHKRENNYGYPLDVQNELHLYSRIIGLCDTFEALTHKRYHRKAFHPADAIKTMIKDREIYFGKDILRTLIDCLSIYPVGSFVQLNNKKIALVVESVKGAPLKPTIQIIRDVNGSSLSGKKEKIDLSKEVNLYITGLVYDEAYQVP